MTESDRDDLAQIIFTAFDEASWQTWEHTSDGIRAWCRAKADEAMAAGWRKLGAGERVVSRTDVESIMDAAKYTKDNTYFWEKWKYQAPYDRLKAALADPAGANGGE